MPYNLLHENVSYSVLPLSLNNIRPEDQSLQLTNETVVKYSFQTAL